MNVQEVNKIKPVNLHSGKCSVYMLVSKEDRTDPETGKFLPAGKGYIGQTNGKPEDRWRNGNNYGGNELGEDIKIFGWDAFDHILLYTNANQSQAIFFEKLETLRKKTLYPNGYNMKVGVDGHYAPFAGRTRPVWQLDLKTGERLRLYLSCASASRATGINVTGIADTARGEQMHAGGFDWAYATKEEVAEWRKTQSPQNNP